jgi:signal transduction histidine kinase
MFSYPGALSQVITNLMMNSMEHGFEGRSGGSIQIDVTQTQGGIKIEYIDDGRGISEKNMPRIFEPFFSTKRQEGNTGLGMHIVFNLVTQRLEGRIQMGRPEVGVQFIIELPGTI